MAWLKRFSLHLAAAVGATGIFIGAVAVGAHQARQQLPTTVVAGPTVAPRTRTPAVVARRTPTPAVNPERSLSGTVRELEPDGVVVVTIRGQEWHVRPVPGALIRLDGKAAAVDTLQPGDRVVILGLAQGKDRFLAHAITAKRNKS